jgi:preprotein translocase subunit SecF
MQFLNKTNIDFMKYRRHFIVVSLVLNVVAIFAVFVHGKLNLGIDFAGGTQLTLKFHEAPAMDQLRSLLDAGGVTDSQLQRFGEVGDHEVLIKTPTVEGSEEGSREAVVKALDGRFNPGAGDKVDLNRAGAEAISALLSKAQGTPGAEASLDSSPTEVAEAIVALRRERGLITDWDQVKALDGVSAKALAALRQGAILGSYAVLGVENVGPQIGKELRRKGLLAVVLSLVGMLIYIWVRFELRFGIGATVASLHDVLIVLGLFALAGYEFNLTTVAAFLTLIGYSVNDTVVIFDRVRENLRRNRRTPTAEVMNVSLNQTLSRTVLTSGTTLLAVTCLYVLGGDVIRGFAFVMVVGVVVGTYSSVYIACPFALLWEQRFSRQARSQRAANDRPVAKKAS